MIHFFCNDRYGLPLAETAAKFALAQKAPLRVIISGREIKTWGRAPIAWLRTLRAGRALAEKRRDLHYRLGVPVAVVPNINDPHFFKTIAPGDHGIVAGFNQIFRRPTIERFTSLVNFHPSLLPHYRGPVPSFWCLTNGEAFSGFTLHEITEEIDAGRILHQEMIAIQDGWDESVLDQQIARSAAPTLHRYLTHLFHAAKWNVTKVDSSTIYRSDVGYLSFPGKSDGSTPVFGDRRDSSKTAAGLGRITSN